MLYKGNKERIKPKRYGEATPIIPIKEFKKMRTQSEKEKTWRTNRRIEIVLLEI